MTPVKQIRGDDGSRIGDCFRACIASILDLTSADVPHFYEGLHPGADVPWQTRLRIRTWFAERGLYLIDIPMEGTSAEEVMEAVSNGHPRLHYLLCGKSVKGVHHCVVCRGAKMVHDPSGSSWGIGNPTDDGCYHILFIGKLV